MESDLSADDSEKIEDDFKYSASGWPNYYRKKTEWIFYGLLALLYTLILALFIMVLNRSTSDFQTVSKKEIQDFNRTGKTCETGWTQFQNRCYFAGKDKCDWTAARKLCVQKGSDLVVIDNNKEQIFLTGKLSPAAFRRFWIGLHDLDVEGQWKWVDGTDYENSLKFWDEGEPNDHDEGEDCAHLWTNGLWNDVPCTYDNCYPLCEKSL
ncbi:hepatic lectin-like isoform X2 [Hyperolius riggenbachi]|uniref:hepatic lectin-like isoform X2 n=1 Tax=Hyperolius riggenbachi TaxID=752182 RepID=UPI0035A3A310